MALPPSTAEPITVADVDAAVAARDIPRAIGLAEALYARGNDHPSVLNLVAYKLEVDERIPEALEVLQQAVRKDPNDPYLWNSIGVCESKRDRPLEALQAFDRALALEPRLAHAHNGRGIALAAIGDRAAAREAQQRAAALDPNFADPLGSLAAVAAEEKQWEEARALASRALAIDPAQPAAVMAMAAVENEAGEYEAAIVRIRRLLAGARLTRLNEASAEHLLAEALESLGRHKEAMTSYIAANRNLRATQVPALQAKELGADTCRRLIAYFEAADPKDWRPLPESSRPGGETAHVFLVGFARSGTTLLEQILASHPDIVPLEEKPTLDDAIREFFDSNEGLDRLSSLTEAAADRWREEYWRVVRHFGVEPAGKVFVDKLPLHTIYLPLVAKLFPRAKVLLARRDPRDVVVSCFRKRFRPNPLVVEFTDLERTAQVYAGAMRLAEIYQRKLPLPIHALRHEDLIEDLDGVTREICAFIGVPWDARMRDFVETANRRDIRTPSAGQVRQGLNRSGVAHWRKYGAAIDPIKPLLAEWVAKFGYPET